MSPTKIAFSSRHAVRHLRQRVVAFGTRRYSAWAPGELEEPEGHRLVQTLGQPFLQYQHSPQEEMNEPTARSPVLKFVIPAPTSTTSPMYSWPMIQPVGGSGMRPS